MAVYYWQIALLFLSWIVSKFTKNPKKTMCILSFIILAVVLGLRDPVGGFNGDNGRYYREYYMFGSSSISACFTFKNGRNTLFYMVYWLFGHLGLKYELFNILLACFSVGVASWFIYKYSDDPLVSFFIYMGLLVYPLSFYLVKQAVAVPVTLLSYDRCRENHRVKGVLLCLTAMLIHDSAIIFFAAVFADKIIKFSKINILFLSAFAVFVFIFKAQIGRILVLIYNSEYLGVYSSKEGIGGMAIVLLGLFAFYLISINMRALRKASSDDGRMIGYEHSLFSLGAIALFIQILSSYAYAFTRLNLFYLPYYMLIFPHSIVQRRWKLMFKNLYPLFRMMVSGVIIAAMCWLYLGTQGPYDSGYRFFWESRVWTGFF